jgi:restriction system protein
LKARPEKMRDLSPRRFEELVASLLEDLGYDVELTSRGADGGVDIFASQKNELGEALVIADCKRYSPETRVGVGIVRALYGLSESFRATKALLATTSFFTRPALAFEAQVPYRLGLKDYDALVKWIGGYKGKLV